VEIHDTEVKTGHMRSRMEELNFEQRDRVATMSASPTGISLAKVISPANLNVSRLKDY
jgi:hypothetical protein